mmetsp:Transcript_19064/g.44832  ORF Transcript_19064/g.44832 Transcript_19064/m.44832 type:complete len:215 (+) Transcript_19064:106-750(+)
MVKKSKVKGKAKGKVENQIEGEVKGKVRGKVKGKVRGTKTKGLTEAEVPVEPAPAPKPTSVMASKKKKKAKVTKVMRTAKVELQIPELPPAPAPAPEPEGQAAEAKARPKFFWEESGGREFLSVLVKKRAEVRAQAKPASVKKDGVMLELAEGVPVAQPATAVDFLQGELFDRRKRQRIATERFDRVQGGFRVVTPTKQLGGYSKLATAKSRKI